jgi:hypothetical protein
MQLKTTHLEIVGIVDFAPVAEGSPDGDFWPGHIFVTINLLVFFIRQHKSLTIFIESNVHMHKVSEI